MLSLERELLLNMASQEIVSLEMLNSWFEPLNSGDKESVFRGLMFMVSQAHPTESGIRRALNSFFGDAVCQRIAPRVFQRLRAGDAASALGILATPELLTDHRRYLEFLLALLRGADRERRAAEGTSECVRHWWHADLSKRAVVDRILGNERQLKYTDPTALRIVYDATRSSQ